MDMPWKRKDMELYRETVHQEVAHFFVQNEEGCRGHGGNFCSHQHILTFSITEWQISRTAKFPRCRRRLPLHASAAADCCTRLPTPSPGRPPQQSSRAWHLRKAEPAGHGRAHRGGRTAAVAEVFKYCQPPHLCSGALPMPNRATGGLRVFEPLNVRQRGAWSQCQRLAEAGRGRSKEGAVANRS
jgi:hypothetical protein